MKKSYKILLGVLIVIIALIIGCIMLFNSINKGLNNITLNDFNLSTIEDGVYTGSYSSFPVSATVEVTVTNHVITKIEILKHENGQGSAAEKIVDDVIETQSLEVDIISGATYSSKVILKAIEEALK